MKAVIIYIMGVSGSGKTTIGRQLSAGAGIPFFDGDDFHSAANKEKMKTGIPLNDDDRKDWLQNINRAAKRSLMDNGAIIACSALKEKYREILTEGIEEAVHWVFLQGEYELINERMKARTDHFMPASLLQSQFETLERPVDAIAIDVHERPEEIVKRIMKVLGLPGPSS